MSKLNNIDDAIKNSFENFEVPFDASLWDAIDQKLDQATSNDLTSFDKKVKESVANHEVAYNPSAWSAVESQLVNTGSSYTKWFLAAGLIGLVSFGVYWLTNSEKEIVTDKKTNAKENIAENKSENVSIDANSNNVNSSHKEIINSDLKEENYDIDVKNSTEENTVENTNQTVNSIDPSKELKPNLLNNNSNQNPIQPIVTSKKWEISSPVISGNTVICEGEELKLTASSASDKVNVQWLLNGVAISNQNEIILKNLNSGTHSIELVYTAKNEFKNTCLNPEIKKSTEVEIKENASVDFKFVQDGDAFYPETKFNVLSTEKNVKYTWILDNKSFVGEELIYLFNNKGNYPVKLLAENENGCRIEEVKNIEISTDYNLLAPIAFTPNFDGLNDVFIPEALKYLNLPFTMNIYDRQQGIVFQTTRSDIPWDGKNMNTGEFGSQGAYLWVVELTNKKGEIEQYSGTITILK